MTTILNKFRSLAIGVIVFSFFIGFTLSSCNTGKKAENTENVEATSSENEEHPAGEEHTTDEEHPAGEEHPSDSTAAEHPAN